MKKFFKLVVIYMDLFGKAKAAGVLIRSGKYEEAKRLINAQ